MRPFNCFIAFSTIFLLFPKKYIVFANIIDFDKVSKVILVLNIIFWTEFTPLICLLERINVHHNFRAFLLQVKGFLGNAGLQIESLTILISSRPKSIIDYNLMIAILK